MTRISSQRSPGPPFWARRRRTLPGSCSSTCQRSGTLSSTAFHKSVGLALLCRDRVSTNTTSPAHSGSLGSCAAVPVCHADSTSPLGMRASASDTDFR